jgi:tRNA(Ile)-lysidine synthase
MNVLQAVYNFFAKYKSSERVLVAVSGGADSLVLLHSLLEYRNQKPPLYIEVFHLNHKIRGATADADAAFVQKFCAENQIFSHIIEEDVPAAAKSAKIGLEEAARQMRYRWLNRLCAEREIPLVLTAHTADDNAETVLLRLLRGTGLSGLAGIPEIAPLPGSDSDSNFRVGRPLLNIWRREIEMYCFENLLTPRRDETNFTLEYTRNKVRLDLLPRLETEYQPGVKRSLHRLAELARDEEAWLDTLVEREFRQNLKDKADHKIIAFERSYWESQPVALQRRLLRRAIAELNGSQNVMMHNIERVRELFALGKAGQLDLPGKLVAFAGQSEVGVYERYKYASHERYELPEAGVLLNIPGKFTAPDNRWELSSQIVHPDGGKMGNRDKFHARLDYAKIGAGVIIRRRQAGDRYRALGAPGRRKLQDIMVDAKIPRADRDALPVLALADDPNRIIWLPGSLIADDFKVTQETKLILEIVYTTTL